MIRAFESKWLAALLVLWLAPALSAETIILKDGTFIDGEIVVETRVTVKIQTKFGARTLQKRDIEKIVKTRSALDPGSVQSFTDVDPVIAAVINAQADYDLGNYERAEARIEPYKDYDENPAVRIKLDWLAIELLERQGEWGEAKERLEEKQKEGTPAEQERAKAHLDIFKDNPDYDLRFVGKTHARNFVRDTELRNKAKEPDSLKDARIMRIALEEYCDQILQDDKVSVFAFRQKLDTRRTYEACRKLTPTGDFVRQMPYFDDLARVEASLRKARAVLGDYSEIYELDLIRVEAEHLLGILEFLFRDLAQRSPDTLTPAFDANTGRLTRAGRERWQEACDEFLEALKPLSRINNYVIEKASAYPEELRDLLKLFGNLKERVDHMEKAVKKARNKSHV